MFIEGQIVTIVEDVDIEQQVFQIIGDFVDEDDYKIVSLKAGEKVKIVKYDDSNAEYECIRLSTGEEFTVMTIHNVDDKDDKESWDNGIDEGCRMLVKID